MAWPHGGRKDAQRLAPPGAHIAQRRISQARRQCLVRARRAL